jgi:hypothetical protein
MTYNHLKGNPFLEQGITGAIVNSTNIIIPVAAGTSKYKLEENSPVERNIMVGLHVTLAGQKVDQTNTQISGNNFNSAYLIIKQRQTDAFDKISLERIRKANDFGRPYYVELKGPVNLSETVLMVPNSTGIAADSVVEIQVDHVRPTQPGYDQLKRNLLSA